MQQTISIILLSASIFVIFYVHLANAGDPIADRSARYQCRYDNGTANLTILTAEFHSIDLKLSNQLTSEKYNLQDKSVFDRTNGKCTFANETIQYFSLVLNERDHLQFGFEGNSSSYHLEKIIYTQLDNSGTSSNYGLNKPDLRITGNALKPEIQYYKCAKLALTLKDQQNDIAAEITLGDFMFFAFENSVESSNATQIECHKPADKIEE